MKGKEGAAVVKEERQTQKHPIFDAMVKNFSQMAYINSGKGLALFPQVIFLEYPLERFK